jgi:hypothetical protein
MVKVAALAPSLVLVVGGLMVTLPLTTVQPVKVCPGRLPASMVRDVPEEMFSPAPV